MEHGQSKNRASQDVLRPREGKNTTFDNGDACSDRTGGMGEFSPPMIFSPSPVPNPPPKKKKAPMLSSWPPGYKPPVWAILPPKQKAQTIFKDSWILGMNKLVVFGFALFLQKDFVPPHRPLCPTQPIIFSHHSFLLK